MAKHSGQLTARQQEVLAVFREWIEATDEGEKIMNAVQSALPTGKVTIDFVGATFATFGLMTIARAVRSRHANATEEERAAIYNDWVTVVGHLGEHFDKRHADDTLGLDPKKAN